MDFAVIGAGVLGLSIAWHLTHGGAERVEVVDARGPGGGTTPAGAGFVYRYAVDASRQQPPSAVEIGDYGMSFYSSLAGRGHDLEMSHNGHLILRTTEGALADLSRDVLGHPGVTPETRAVDPDEVARLTSGIVSSSAVAGGVFSPDALQVTTSAVLRALDRELDADPAVTVRYGAEVDTIIVEDNRVVGLRILDGTVIRCSRIVLACGAWTNRLLKTVDRRLPLAPVVASRFVSEPAQVPRDLPTIQFDSPRGWLRELAGCYSWGVVASYEPTDHSGTPLALGRPTGVPPHADESVTAASRIFPGLANSTIAALWRGYPVFTGDGLPFLSSIPGVTGLWVAAGDNESGVMNGPGWGRVMAEQVLGTPPTVDASPFRWDDRAESTEEPAVFEAIRAARSELG